MEAKNEKTHRARIELILWDVGNVINDGAAFWKKRSDLAAEYDVSVDAIIEYSDQYRSLVDLGRISEFAFWHKALLFAGVSEHCLEDAPLIGSINPHFPPPNVEAQPLAILDYADLNDQPSYADVVSYVAPVVGTLAVMSDLQGIVRHGILSNDSSELGRLKMWQLYAGLVDEDVFIISADLGQIKPNPLIFWNALKRAGLEKHPECVVFIDDSEKYCNAARSVGMNSILFRNPEQVRQDLREFGISN